MDTIDSHRRDVAPLMERILYETKKIVVGQDRFLERVLVAILAQGHLLVEGVPGLAKTLTVKTLAQTMRGAFRRIQFTPDLVPADLVGTRIYNQRTGEFSTQVGPVFTNLLLADEINRAPAKVQSALLEAMQERQVTIGDQTYPLSDPFLVLATQNPLEQEGTYPLPEAQLDRFLLKIRVTYPSAADEMQILTQYEKGFDPRRLDKIALDPIDVSLLPAARREIESVRVEPALHSYVVSLVRRTRDWPAISLGGSPRAIVGLFFVARALAGMDGRDFLLPDDVKAAALPVLRHRILLKPEADLEGLTPDQVIAQVISAVEVPK